MNGDVGGLLCFGCTVGAVIGAVINGRKGHSPLVGFLGGALLGPVLVWLLLLSKSKKHRKCPFCAERIRREAKVCRYCQREVVSPAGHHLPLPEEGDEEQDPLAEFRRRLIGLTPHVYVTWTLIASTCSFSSS